MWSPIPWIDFFLTQDIDCLLTQVQPEWESGLLEVNVCIFPFNFLGAKVVLFCVKADFNGDEVCLSFCGDNGVRSVLLNASIQYPLVQVR